MPSGLTVHIPDCTVHIPDFFSRIWRCHVVHMDVRFCIAVSFPLFLTVPKRPPLQHTTIGLLRVLFGCLLVQNFFLELPSLHHSTFT